MANNVYEYNKKKGIITYIHKAAFSPVKSTWIQAINAGFYSSWPGLTVNLAEKHLPKSPATIKGHQRQFRQHLRSTSSTTTPLQPSTPHVMTTPSPSDEVQSNVVSMKMVEIKGKMFSDQTGRFSITSSKGNKYIMVMYDNDSNAILAEAIKNRSQQEIVRAQKKLHDYLTSRGFRPLVQILDNECPDKLKEHFHQRGMEFRLVPPPLHRNNAAERAIATFKDHFVAGLTSTDPSFPMHLWCRLLPHATTTLNLLRPSRINPKVSAEAILNGSFDYNKTLLAPPGTRVIVHEAPSVRRTWAQHGVDGWYIGGAPEHYRCHQCYIAKTRAERIARTVEFFPYLYDMPKTSSADATVDAVTRLTTALLHPHSATPFAPIAENQLVALRQLAEIFAHQVKPPPRTEAAPVPRTLPAPRVPKRVPHRIPTEPIVTSATPRVREGGHNSTPPSASGSISDALAGKEVRTTQLARPPPTPRLHLIPPNAPPRVHQRHANSPTAPSPTPARGNHPIPSMLSTDTGVVFQTPPQSGPHLIEDDDDQVPTYRYPLRSHDTCRLDGTAPLQNIAVLRCSKRRQETSSSIVI